MRAHGEYVEAEICSVTRMRLFYFYMVVYLRTICFSLLTIATYFYLETTTIQNSMSLISNSSDDQIFELNGTLEHAMSSKQKKHKQLLRHFYC